MCQEINAVKTQNGEISDPTELAECFNDYFINVGPDIAIRAIEILWTILLKQQVS